MAASADVNGNDEYGSRPLHYAAASGALEVVRLLLEERASPNATNHDGRAPLAFAEERGHHQVAALLREALDVMPVPLQLFADVEAGVAAVSCFNLEGDTLQTLRGELPKTGRDLAKFIAEALPAKSRTRWTLILPCGELLEDERLSVPLNELLGLARDEVEEASR